jgi:hypothetical protein
MTTLTKLIFLIVSTGLARIASGQDIKTFTGTIDYKFHLSSTHTLNENQKKELDTDIEFYAQKEKLLTDYFTKLNFGDNEGAKKILKKDKGLKEKDDFTLAYMFTILKMKELKILYKPCIQVNDDKADGIIISCSTEQLDKLRSSDKEFQLECRYVGELIVDKAKAYELVTVR